MLAKSQPYFAVYRKLQNYTQYLSAFWLEYSWYQSKGHSRRLKINLHQIVEDPEASREINAW